RLSGRRRSYGSAPQERQPVVLAGPGADLLDARGVLEQHDRHVVGELPARRMVAHSCQDEVESEVDGLTPQQWDQITKRQEFASLVTRLADAVGEEQQPVAGLPVKLPLAEALAQTERDV